MLDTNENSRAPFTGKQRGGLHQGLGYAKAPTSHCHLAKTFPAVQLAWFMEGWNSFCQTCTEHSLLTSQSVRHNLQRNEKYGYFTDHLPCIASQEDPFYKSVVMLHGHGILIIILGTDSGNGPLGCVRALECV